MCNRGKSAINDCFVLKESKDKPETRHSDAVSENDDKQTNSDSTDTKELVHSEEIQPGKEDSAPTNVWTAFSLSYNIYHDSYKGNTSHC